MAEARPLLGAEKEKIVRQRIKRPRVDLNAALDDPALYQQVEYCHAIKKAKCKL